MSRTKVKKTIQALAICIAVILSLVVPAPKAYAADGQCQEASCSGTYDNGFCSKCGGYEAPKQVSANHYSQLNGTHNGYYAIENAGQLYWVAETVNSGTTDINVVLVADIVINKNVLDGNGQLNSANAGSFVSWKPIGNYTYEYEGIFDGNNHSISGLYFVGNLERVGLFGDVYNAKIKNVGVVDSYIYCEGNAKYIGGIVGNSYYSDITNCYNEGNMIVKYNSYVSDPQIGGIVGAFDYGKITNCYNTGDIAVTIDYDGAAMLLGGVAGGNFGSTMENCYNTGDIHVEDIKSDGINVGGVVGGSFASGSDNCVYKNCYNNGDITAKVLNEVETIFMSGVIALSQRAELINCYNSGDVSAEISAGIEYGAMLGGLIGNGFEGKITNSFNAGNVTVSGEGVEATEDVFEGAIAGNVPSYSITNCYYNSDIYAGEAIGNGNDNNVLEKVSGKTTEQFKSGEVAYLLNDSRTEGTEDNPLVWYQTTGEDGVPTLDNTHEVVYYENGKYGNYTPEINVFYRTHIQTFGWEGNANDISTWKSNGTMSGTSGKAKRLEGINIVVNSAEANESVDLGIQYTTHCQSYGWLPWSANGEMNGTEGEAKRLEAIKIQLTGADKDSYDVYYRVHAQSYGWLGWAKNGASAGTAGYAKRLEGIQIVVVKKDESFNQKMGNITSARTEAFVAKEGSSPIVNHEATSNTNPVVPGADEVNVAYRTHVQSFGWQAWKYNGQMSGTSGQAKRLEGINIELRNKDCSGDIVYTTHVQTYGWQGSETDQSKWFKNGQMAGTSGEAKRLEAICINLTGEMAANYDIYYRVHAQSYGWLGWAKNGAPAGTAGYGKRLEGIQVVLVPKNGAAPGDYQGIKSVRAEAYVSK
ncbi:MAG: hypothetical protein E7263_07750 [Lachnospiraceae bacterium]|nr:hypothetical protein [Lachnospiraceae bacterium]